MKNNARRRPKSQSRNDSIGEMVVRQTTGIIKEIYNISEQLKGNILNQRYKSLVRRRNRPDKISVGFPEQAKEKQIPNPLFEIVGVSGDADGPSDGAINHDKYLYKKS